MRHCVWILACLFLVACGDDEAAPTVEATLTDHADALTDQGGDRLFDMEITTADQSFAPADLQLSIQPADGAAVNLTLDLSTDADSDGDAGKGDVITGIEPVDDVIGVAEAGAAYDVSLVWDDPESEEDPVEIWSGSWTAN